MNRITEKTLKLFPPALICIALILVTCAVYWQVVNHEFLSYDDDLYIAGNTHVAKGITGANVVWAFTSTEQCNWHPVTWLSHMLDVQLFGMNPGSHHLTNVVMHCIATLLLFLLLVRSTSALWQSSFVAALFALHPLHVETVAWAAERKDVLSACFGFLMLLLYLRYVETGRSKARSGTSFYLFTLFSFVLGLMSKPMLVMLPLVMLLFDYWPLRRFGVMAAVEENGRRSFFSLIREKIPFFICSALSAAVTIYAQSKGGAVVALDSIPFIIRLQNSFVSYLKYVLKAFWPHDLAVMYPFFLSIPLWQVLWSAMLLLLISALVIRAGRHYPYLPVGWFWFVLTLLPVIGLIQVGNQSMADRYMYIPAVGLFIMAAWGVPALFHSGNGLAIYSKFILALSASAVIITAGAVSWHQIGYWKDSITLYRHTLDVTAGNYVINYNLGIEYGRTGNLDAAIKEFRTALGLKPNDAKVRNLLAATLAEKGDVDGAIAEYTKTLLIDPQDSQAAHSLEYWRTRRSGQNR